MSEVREEFDDRLKNVLSEADVLHLQMADAWRRGDEEEEAWIRLELAQKRG